MSIPAYPLQWPQGWPRVRYRKEAKFATKGSTNENGWRPTVDITMADAMKRVKYELERLGVNVADDSIVSTNLKLNLSDRKSTRLNSSHLPTSRMPSSA